MQPQFLFVKIRRIVWISKEETVFDQYNPGRTPRYPHVFAKQLIWKNQEVQVDSLYWKVDLADGI